MMDEGIILPSSPSNTGSGTVLSEDTITRLVIVICVDVKLLELPSLYSDTEPVTETRSPIAGFNDSLVLYTKIPSEVFTLVSGSASCIKNPLYAPVANV